MLTRLVYLTSFTISVFGCVATSSAGTPTTTAAPGVTTTTVTTTTTVASGCNSCTADEITYSTRGGIFIDAIGTISTDATTGCLGLLVTCTADANYWPYMYFNNNYLAGPHSTTSTEIEAPLACVNGNWVFTEDGVSSVITRVICQEAPQAG